jgi:hypothetical protein
MRYINIAAFLFCLIHSVANAQPTQTEKTVVCDKIATVFEVLKEAHQEIPVWGGQNTQEKSYYALMLNPETKTWTLVQFNGIIACVLGTGNDYVTR